MFKSKNKSRGRLDVKQARKSSAIWYEKSRAGAESSCFGVVADNVALVQCWECGYDQSQQFGIGRPEEIRCRLCLGRVEILAINGVVAQSSITLNRLAIVGSRDYPDMQAVRTFVSRLRKTTVVVSGGARGVDSVAVLAARERGLTVEEWPADWKTHGKAAGPIRNEAMIATVDGLVAFWDGVSRGTAHAIECARRRGIWLKVVNFK